MLETECRNVFIFGDNGAGKTTLFDAFTWLLFGKDSHDISKFDVQPLDNQGNVVHMVDVEVEGILQVDGKNIILKRALKEKWVKPKGKSESELRGTETLYYVDEVPMKEGEYKDKINSIIDENIFKLVTSPIYFSTSLPWRDRRKVLMDILGDIDDMQVINYKRDLAPLASLLVDKDIEALKKSIAARKTKLKNDIQGIPPRVDELQRSIQEFDFNALDTLKQDIISRIKGINDKLADSSKIDEEVLKDKKRLIELQNRLLTIEQEAKKEAQRPLDKLYSSLQEANNELNTARTKVIPVKCSNDIALKEIARLEESNQELKNSWFQENERTLEFSDNVFECPTCHRPFDDADVEGKKQEMTESFNLNKAKKLGEINAAGKANKQKIDELKKQIEDSQINTLEFNVKALEAKYQEIKTQIDNFNSVLDLSGNSEYQNVKHNIFSLQNKLQQPVQVNLEETQLKSKKTELEKELEDVNSKLLYTVQNERTKNRIEELKKEEKTLSQQLADLEKQEFLTDEFTKTKAELMESSINSKFKYVRFKMFNILVNGGVEECCEAMVNGVPFGTNLNSGAKMNAGVDIINALCSYYQVKAPIFIDNRESVTKLISTDSQIISLVVSEEDKTLRIERYVQ
jgi:DNA repair exonuclease SbcCD ATPase subunit